MKNTQVVLFRHHSKERTLTQGINENCNYINIFINIYTIIYLYISTYTDFEKM